MKKVFLFAVIFLAITSCATGGVVHRVKRGETLWRICRTYEVDLERVARVNRIKDPSDIRAGMKIFIPGARTVREVPPASKNTPASLSRYRDSFIWPVKGKVYASYGAREGLRNDGIDIRVENETPVRASADGKVVYVDNSFKAYGNIIIIEHTGGIYTVYAHSKRNIAQRGKRVSRGEVIATAGPSDGYIHFEVRRGKTPVDPLFFLP